MSRKNLVKRFGLELFFVALLALFYFFYQFSLSENYERYNVSFQARFSEKVEKLNRLLIYEKHRFEHFGLKNIWEKKIEDNFNLHIYRNDSLKYWSSNELPVLGFADIHFPDKGLLHLQNGWYYAQVLEIDNVVFCASFLIKKDYAYQNQDLENSFAPDFHLPFSANLSLSEEDFSIKGTDGEFLFSIVPSEKQEVGELGESVLLILMYGLVLLSFLLLFKWLRVFFPKAWIWLIPLVFVVYRFILFQSTPSNAFEKLTFFQPSLLALSEISPNFISFSLNAFFILAFLNWFWIVLISTFF